MLYAIAMGQIVMDVMIQAVKVGGSKTSGYSGQFGSIKRNVSTYRWTVIADRRRVRQMTSRGQHI